jgi:hypothetical protein
VIKHDVVNEHDLTAHQHFLLLHLVEQVFELGDAFGVVSLAVEFVDTALAIVVFLVVLFSETEAVDFLLHLVDSKQRFEVGSKTDAETVPAELHFHTTESALGTVLAVLVAGATAILGNVVTSS